jgi:hypothetical protein
LAGIHVQLKRYLHEDIRDFDLQIDISGPPVIIVKMLIISGLPEDPPTFGYIKRSIKLAMIYDCNTMIVTPKKQAPTA